MNLVKYRGDNWFCAILVLFMVIFLSAILAVGITSKTPRSEVPYGCTYLDMNTSKGADYRLACVPGFFPTESEHS